MPEIYFHVRWPDGTTERCYSPSTVVEDYVTAGAVYDLADFVGRSRTALGIASDRVRATYGFACTGASDQLTRIERVAAGYAGQAGAKVTVESIVNADGSPR
ncbi:MSMEG_0570 family nitrogen starvation response protein [Actinacidiphila acididurans]|uniref:MSMEG_0570 family nitrogen starvation response protein n=1 Tax=Actinacidiphila acididurans TaxID=2784346 RepID=A0ABS2TSP6_9ACTN|nr:MSMEG_0570 family nitrogen starvation response protein [Actinacidiphila acididurans]MBM9506344.1 MSMEG_0570 family nitrogen starvation response protein [Actinacidiphila acididurans]